MRFVSKIALGAAALLAMGGAAMAADLMAPPPPAAAVTSGWDGLYLGAQGSYADDIGVEQWVSGDFIVGGNLTIGDSFLLGLEGGIGGYYIVGGGGSGNEETIAVRAGFIAGGSTLIYGTAGEQWYNFDSASNSPFIGGGVEFKATDQMSIRLQAVAFGQNDYQVSTGIFWHMQ